jgi:hypothetical protein
LLASLFCADEGNASATVTIGGIRPEVGARRAWAGKGGTADQGACLNTALG